MKRAHFCLSRCDEGALAVGEHMSHTDKDSNELHRDTHDDTL